MNLKTAFYVVDKISISRNFLTKIMYSVTYVCWVNPFFSWYISGIHPVKLRAYTFTVFTYFFFVFWRKLRFVNITFKSTWADNLARSITWSTFAKKKNKISQKKNFFFELRKYRLEIRLVISFWRLARYYIFGTRRGEVNAQLATFHIFWSSGISQTFEILIPVKNCRSKIKIIGQNF